MFDLTKAFRGMSTQRKSLGMPFPDWQFIRNMWVPMTDDGRKYIDKVFKGNVYAHSIISHIVDKASDAPGGVYREKKGQKSKARAYHTLTKCAYSKATMFKSIELKAKAFDELEDHPFMALMEKPNPIQNGKQWRRDMMGYERITGNGFGYAATPGTGINANVPIQLWVIPSPCVEIVMGTRIDPVAGYKVSYYGEDVIDKSKIIHMKTFNPVCDITGGDWLYGMAPAKAGRSSFSQFDAAETAQGTMWSNMGPGGILSGQEKGSISQAQGVAIQDEFVKKHTGLVNGGGIVVTPALVNWTEIGMSPVDLNILEGKGNLLQEICAIYHYPIERITGSQNVASQGTADKQVITSCVMPLLRDFDDCITAFIRQAYNDDSLVYISDTQYFPELQEDRKDLATWLNAAWWIDVNEKRKAMDYDEKPDGDVMLVPSSMVKFEDVIADVVDPDVDMLDNEGLLNDNQEEEDATR